MLLVACCYWKRANSWGATGAIILGASIPIIYLLLEQFWKVQVVLDGVPQYLPDGKPLLKSVLERIDAADKVQSFATIGQIAEIAVMTIVGTSVLRLSAKSEQANGSSRFPLRVSGTSRNTSSDTPCPSSDATSNVK